MTDSCGSFSAGGIYNPILETNCSCYSNIDESAKFSADLFAVVAKHCQSDKVPSIVSKIEALVKFEEAKNDRKYEFQRVSDIEQYCVDRLDEIELINILSPTPSAFVTIGAFIGFLSRLVYGDNDKKRDGLVFKKFVKRFMKGYPPERMYKTFRCGIVHAMSFYPTVAGGRTSDVPSRRRFPWVLIAHDSGCKNLSRHTISNHNITVLRAASVIKDLRTTIKTMFLRRDVQKNCVAFTAWQPPIVGEIKNAVGDGMLSGYTILKQSQRN